MKTVYILMSAWDDGHSVFNTVHKVFRKKASADHQAILLNETKFGTEVTYYVIEYLVED